ncbi:MAG: hypothetical protein CH6_0923 [Candidatus Kapaibacterium sp.]|nr:MAG: hypothetical protein CH6_0923 [Candidatus Kapabacteria bacterium]
MKKFFLLFFIISEIAFAQMIPKWEVIFSVKEAEEQLKANIELSYWTVFDSTHYLFVSNNSSRYISEKNPCLGFFFNGGEKNVLKLENPNDVQCGFAIHNPQYIDSNLIFCVVDSSYFHYTDGVNIYRKYTSFIYKSTDGGKNWQTYPTSKNLILRKRPSAWFQMTDSLSGILVQYPDTLENTDRIIITEDGWKTYIEIGNQIIAGTKMAAYSQGSIVIFTQKGEMYYTNNFGKSWNSMNFIKEVGATGVYFLRNSTILIPAYDSMSKRFTIFKSKNLGQTWDTIFSSTQQKSSPLFSILNDSSFAFIDDSLNVFFTRDNGKSWKRYSKFYLWVYLDGTKLYLMPFFVGEHLALATAFTLLDPHYVLRWYGDSTLAPPEFYEPQLHFKLPLDFELKWGPIEGAESYHLQIIEREGYELYDPKPAPDFEKTPLYVDTVIKSLTFKIPNTKYYKEYTCRIRSLNQYPEQTSPWYSDFYVTAKEPNFVDDNDFDTKIKSNYLLIEKSKSNELGYLYENYPFDIYNLLGLKLLSNCGPQQITILPNGFYILKSKKRVIFALIID